MKTGEMDYGRRNRHKNVAYILNERANSEATATEKAGARKHLPEELAVLRFRVAWLENAVDTTMHADKATAGGGLDYHAILDTVNDAVFIHDAHSGAL